MSALNNANHYTSLFEQQTTLPSQLQILRQQAMQQFLQQGFPNARIEAWKYTPMDFLANMDFISSKAAQAITMPKHLMISNTYRAVFINGLFSESASILPSQDSVTCMSLQQAISLYPNDIFDYLKNESSSFSDFNTAFFSDGLFFKIQAQTTLDKPLHLLFINHAATANTMQQLRNIIIAEKNSQATIIEHYFGTSDETSLTNNLTQIHLQEQSQLTHLILQEEDSQNYHISQMTAHLNKKANLQTHLFDLGSQLTRRELQVSLDEPGSHCNISGLYHARNRQHIDNHTYLHHRCEHTTSQEIMKGIIGERARAVFNGNITVYPNAQKTDAQLKNHNLLLSDFAEVDTKPELEIYADDVKCAHGATVGQLDTDALFYLESRGIPASEAKNMLLSGFAFEAIQAVTQTILCDYIKQRFMSALQSCEAKK